MQYFALCNNNVALNVKNKLINKIIENNTGGKKSSYPICGPSFSLMMVIFSFSVPFVSQEPNISDCAVYLSLRHS